jgi:hypothetical protein
MSLFQFWKYETEDSNVNEIKKPEGFGLMDGIICSIITIIRLLLGYFSPSTHPLIPPNSTEVYPNQYVAA